MNGEECMAQARVRAAQERRGKYGRTQCAVLQVLHAAQSGRTTVREMRTRSGELQQACALAGQRYSARMTGHRATVNVLIWQALRRLAARGVVRRTGRMVEGSVEWELTYRGRGE